MVRSVIDLFLRGEVDRVDIVYNEFKSVAQQRIVIEQFLPLVPEATAIGSRSARGSIIFTNLRKKISFPPFYPDI